MASGRRGRAVIERRASPEGEAMIDGVIGFLVLLTMAGFILYGLYKKFFG